MKKIFLPVYMLLMALSLGAQTYPVSVVGNVVDTGGDPVEGVQVQFYIPPSATNPFTYSEMLSSDVNGNFFHSTDVPNDVLDGQLGIIMEDCDTITSQYFNFSANGTNNFIASFVYCESNNPYCYVYINEDTTGANLQLTANPYGLAPFTYLWSTGETTQTIDLGGANAGTYCVTMTDAFGCVSDACYEYTPPPACSVNISNNPSGGNMTAYAWGVAPYSYLWNSGETTATISPNYSGNFCVTMTDSEGCVAEDCAWFSYDSCDVVILVDSLGPTGTWEYLLTAQPIGDAPFTYQWDIQNFQTQSIAVPNTNATYCVTVTDANGCSSTSCVTIVSIPDCEVNIYQGDSVGITILDAIVWPGNGPFTFLWSTGETTQYIEPVTAGNYCVTITTGDGCEASDCFDFDPLQGSPIQGYIYLPDSLNPVMWEGYVELYQLDPATGDYELFNTVDMEGDPSGYFQYYDFGEVELGSYIVKAYVDPDDPIAPDYLPTYYGNVVEWNEATVINTPSNQWYFNITMDDGQMLTGSGTINGLVYEGDGLLSTGGNDRNPGDPISNVSVLLFDEFENSITHTLTDANGKYSFTELPFGTYKIVVEIVGVEQGVRWVTLSADEPILNGIDFKVNEAEIINGVSEWVGENGFHLFPNPAKSTVTLDINSSNTFDATFNVISSTGEKLIVQEENIIHGQQRINLNISKIPSGIYFLQMTTGNDVIVRRVVKH